MYRQLAKLALQVSLYSLPLIAQAVLADEARVDRDQAARLPRDDKTVQAASTQPTPVLGEVVVSTQRTQAVADSMPVSRTDISRLRPATSDAASLLRDIPSVSL